MPDYSGNKAKAGGRASKPGHEIKTIEEENRVMILLVYYQLVIT